DHPKCCSRAADPDRNRHTRDIAEADCSRNGGRQSLKVVDLAVMALVLDRTGNVAVNGQQFRRLDMRLLMIRIVGHFYIVKFSANYLKRKPESADIYESEGQCKK